MFSLFLFASLAFSSKVSLTDLIVSLLSDSNEAFPQALRINVDMNSITKVLKNFSVIASFL
jgi:hypothetical protein